MMYSYSCFSFGVLVEAVLPYEFSVNIKYPPFLVFSTSLSLSIPVFRPLSPSSLLHISDRPSKALWLTSAKDLCKIHDFIK